METKIISSCDDNGIKEAARILSSGGLVAFPTETVYGLGANALLPGAAKKVYAAKGRPSDNPLIVHLADPEDAEKYARTGETYYRLASSFMPGPLTVILPKKEIIPDEVTGALDSVGIRVPSDKTANKLIRYSGVPVAAPSANLSGKPSTTSAAHVIADLFGRIDCIIDAGEAKIGLESTIVKEESPGVIRMLRPGAITVEMIEALGFRVVLDKAVLSKLAEGERPLAPGMKYRHYAPSARVILYSGTPESVERALLSHSGEPGAAVMCFEEDKTLSKLENSRVIGRRSDRDNTAHRLFSVLRSFDLDRSVRTVYCALPDTEGIGLAIFNRLVKAAGYEIINTEQEQK